jgi:hypothetical protein
LRNELYQRDEKHKEEIKHYKDALVDMQKELEDVKRTLTRAKTNAAACTCNEHHEELRAELQSLRSAVTSPSTGRSWASVTTATSVVSSTTRAARADLGMPAIVMDGRRASAETKELLRDPRRMRKVLSDRLKSYTSTESVRIAGVKALQGSIIKIFLDSEESVTTLQEDQAWLEALPGTVLQGEQWFPVKVNAVTKAAIFKYDGSLRHDFTDLFQMENNGAYVKRLYNGLT